MVSSKLHSILVVVLTMSRWIYYFLVYAQIYIIIYLNNRNGQIALDDDKLYGNHGVYEVALNILEKYVRVGALFRRPAY